MKRIAAALLGLVMMAAALSGCGSQEAANAESKPNLKVLQTWMAEDYNDYPVAKMLEEKTGYHVTYDALPQTNVDEKLNMLIASQEPYDLVSVPAGASVKSLFYSYAAKGALEPLDEYIEKSTYLKSVISDESYDAVRYEGKIYAIPTKSMPDVRGNIIVRKDWLDKLGMKVPETVDDFTEMLRAFRDQDPSGNGADKNIPFSTAGGAIVGNLTGAFGIPADWNDVDGNLVNIVNDPNTKKYIEYMNQLYQEGLIEKEMPANKESTLKEKFTSGRLGAMYLNWYDIPTVVGALEKNISGAEIVSIPILTGPDGQCGISRQNNLERLTFIPKSSKNKEAAVCWMDAKLEPDTFKNLVIGEEGKHHEVKDGKYYPILPIFNDERNKAINFLSGVDENVYETYWQARVRKDTKLMEEWEHLNQNLPPEQVVDDIMGKTPYLKEYVGNTQQLSTLVSDNLLNFIVGTHPMSEYEKFAADWNAQSGEAMSKEVNDWYQTLKNKE